MAPYICIVGLGYVGLPLAIAFAKTGHSVVGADVSKEKIYTLLHGISYINDLDDATIASAIRNGNLIPVNVAGSWNGTEKTAKDKLRLCDTFIICVPTPVSNLNSFPIPDLTYLENACELVVGVLAENKNTRATIISESTTYPGSTQIAFSKKAQPHGIDIPIVFSPERTDPGTGRSPWGISKLVGSMNVEARKKATRLYGSIYKSTVIELPSADMAEAIKCAENAFRFVSISFANALAYACTLKGLDVWPILGHAKEMLPFPTLMRSLEGGTEDIIEYAELADTHQFHQIDGMPRTGFQFAGISEMAFQAVDRICNTNPNGLSPMSFQSQIIVLSFLSVCSRFLADLRLFCDSYTDLSYDRVLAGMMTKGFGIELCMPGPGAGGHCIPVDPFYLLFRARQLGIDLPLISEAHRINKNVPIWTITLLKQRLPELKGRKIVLIGMTYKPDVPDIRESPALAMARCLIDEGVDVFYADPILATQKQMIIGDVENDGDSKNRHSLESADLVFKSMTAVALPELLGYDLFKSCAFDATMILVDHRCFEEHGLYKHLLSAVKSPAVIIDCVNALRRHIGQDLIPDYLLKCPDIFIWGVGKYTFPKAS